MKRWERIKSLLVVGKLEDDKKSEDDGWVEEQLHAILEEPDRDHHQVVAKDVYELKAKFTSLKVSPQEKTTNH